MSEHDWSCVIFLCWILAAWMTAWLLSARVSVWMANGEPMKDGVCVDPMKADTTYTVGTCLGLLGAAFIVCMVAIAFWEGL